ncbi:MAG: hydantoinase/oxoprolinase family protein [Alphaproteobacteria bacterium]|nr:hydantoinase/oxoprolinase family protein [Alphaproteobacteria bacterium]
MAFRIGVDIGGTFTDFALIDDSNGRVAVHKVLTTPRDPSEAVLQGIDELLAREKQPIQQVVSVVHGTTLVTNAVIERKGARTGMLVTRGFRDVIDIALERRYDLYDLRLKLAQPVVPRLLRREVDGRLRADGSEEQALSLEQVLSEVTNLRQQDDIQALAICFMNSYANGRHEEAAREAVAKRFPELYLCTSSDVLPFMREYERWTTATVNAYTQPMTDRYLGRLESELQRRGFTGAFLVMTSSGGAVSAALARRYPVRLIESGPAAGALMSGFLGVLAGAPNLLSFDMGGTTAKGALLRDGQPLKKYELEVARVHEFKQGSGLQLRIPVIDMIEIGAGGGSLAQVDERGLVKVGPQSAGAEPGPACYGRGGKRPTSTDCNVLLGYLDPNFFLGGRMRLDAAAAGQALQSEVAKPLSLEQDRAAFGVHEILNEDVARAFRIHASELGFDYRRCSMVAFGGSGPVHAMRIARKLRIPDVIFPAGAGVMSAIGMLVTPVSFETLRTRRVALAELDAAKLDAHFQPLIDQASAFLKQAGIARNEVTVLRRLDMRYRGQGYEVEVTLPAELSGPVLMAAIPELFRKAYSETFSQTHPDAPMEVVNWKVEGIGPRPKVAGSYQVLGPAGGQVDKGTRKAYLADKGGFLDCRVVNRYALKPGDTVTGPALIEENESTCLIGPGDRAQVDPRYNLIVRLAY